MTLTEFLSKAGQLFGLVEKNLTAEQQLATSQTEVTNLKASLSQKENELATANQALVTANQTIAARDGEIVTLKASLSTKETELTQSQTKLTEAEAKIANPPAQIKTAASQQAAVITQSQGQPPIAVPAAATPAGGQQKTELKGMARVQAAIKEQLAANS